MVNKNNKIKSKIIKITYPHENGTLGFFKKPRWDVVTDNCTYYVYDYATIRAIDILEKIYTDYNYKEDKK